MCLYCVVIISQPSADSSESSYKCLHLGEVWGELVTQVRGKEEKKMLITQPLPQRSTGFGLEGERLAGISL
jgi:hypothetical protein